jgi:hypothetical protein
VNGSRSRAPALTISGGVLLSRGASPEVPSALEGLTSLFGMERGVTPPPWPPKTARHVVVSPMPRGRNQTATILRGAGAGPDLKTT